MQVNEIQRLLDQQREQSKLSKVSERVINSTIHASSKEKDINPEFSEKMSEVAQELRQTVKFQEAYRQGIANRDNTYQAEVNARPDKRAATSAKLKGRKKSDEHLAKVAAKNKERSKRIQTPYGEFESRKAAVVWHQENLDIINVDKKIQKWVTDPASGYHYI